jgi:four helix bundle protein
MDLIAWQKAMTLAVSVYDVTKVMPREEQFGLTAQMRRAAVSIPSNIAEGQGRGSDPAFAHHLSIAHGSSAAVRGILDEAAEVGRLINGLANSIRG